MSLFASHIAASVANLPFASPTLAKVAQRLASGAMFDHLLLHGSPGTGKTTIAETILRERYPQLAPHISSYVYDGANWSANSLDRVRGQINFDRVNGIVQNFTIINEVDQLSSKHLAEMKAFMDDRKDHKFLLTTNHLGKVHANIKSRCSTHQVDLPDEHIVASFVQRVVAAHGHTIDFLDARTLARQSSNDWRRLERAVQLLLP